MRLPGERGFEKLARGVRPYVPQPLVPWLTAAFDRVRRGRIAPPSGSLRRRIQRFSTGAQSVVGERITVVVPCFNEERFLGEALQSLRAQTYTNWECIVVDDASTDASPRIASEFAAADSRIVLVRHRVNGGLSAARNTGLRLTTSPWICFLDADDFLLAGSLGDRAVALGAADEPDVAGVFTGVVTVDENSSLRDYPMRLVGDLEPFIDLLTTGGECPFPAHAPLLKTEVLHRAAGFDESMRAGAEDWDLWRRLLRNGYLFQSAGTRTAAYRMKSGSMVGRSPRAHLELGRGLLASAAKPMVIDDVMVDAPLVMSAPLDEYISGLHVARRTLRFAAMLACEGSEALISAIRAVDPTVWKLLARHDDLDRLIADGVDRARSVSVPSSDQAFNGEAVTAEIRATLSSWSVDAPRDRVPPNGGTVIVPSSAADVQRLCTTADRDATWVCVDREDGNQGTASALADAGLTYESLNELALRPAARFDRVVTGRWPGAAAAMLGRGEHPSSFADAHRLEEYAGLDVDTAGIGRLRNHHAGERCFIIGNGPSLAQTDLTLLKDEATIAVNGIFYARDRMGFDPTYYVVEDTSVMKENLDEIREYQAGQKLFPTIYRSLYGRDDALFFNMNRGFYEPASPNCGTPRFSVDAIQRLYAGQSVTYMNLQLAYFMGFATVILIGMDFSYIIPDDAERDGEVLTSKSDDPNHFHPDYFGEGKTWKDPHLDRVLKSYELAKEMFEADGRRVVNATVGGSLELFDREDYQSLFETVAMDSTREAANDRD